MSNNQARGKITKYAAIGSHDCEWKLLKGIYLKRLAG